MHLKKKRKLFVLYSIPINLCKKISSVIHFSSGRVASVRRRGCGALDLAVAADSFGKGINGTRLHKHEKYLVSYSIPLGCTKALLLVGLGLLGSVICGMISFGGNTKCFAAASATLELGPSTLEAEVSQGGTAYASSTIRASGNDDIGSYTLSITGPAQLVNGSTTLTGANNKTGNALATNTWGYSYDEGSKANESKTYKSFTGSTQELAKASATTGSKVTIDNSIKDITFAAKFADDAMPGEYKATVTVSLVASPASVVYRLIYDVNGGNSGSGPSTDSATDAGDTHTFTISSVRPTRTGYTFLGWSSAGNSTTAEYAAGGTITLQKGSPVKTVYAVWRATATWDAITTMQEMTPEICNSVGQGTTKILKDNRGINPISYKIIKMGDDNCWMAENLRLINTTITSADSDVSSNFTIPDSDIAAFASTDDSQLKVYYDSSVAAMYGAYYNRYVATAGGNTSQSICPKHWTLPQNEGTPSYSGLSSIYESGTPLVIDGVKYGGMTLGLDSEDAFFLAAGRIAIPTDGPYLWGRSEGGYGGHGNYLTRTSSYAFVGSIPPNPITSPSPKYRYDGYSVRCVASY